MSQNPTATDWAAARGDKWRAHLPGTEATLTPVDDPLIRALDLSEPCKIADIGCGGGGTALQILRRAPAGSFVHGFDLSPASIDYARNRAAGERSIAFDVANVATAAAPNQPFDRLVSRFGIMFFEDPSAAFGNLLHWLKPGGKFAFAVWAPPSDNPWLAIVREAVTAQIDLPPIDVNAPGPFRYGDVSKLVGVLQEAGFENVRASTWRGNLPVGGKMQASEAARFALSSFSTFAEQLAQADHGAFDRAHAALLLRLLGHQQEGIVQLPACVYVVTGNRAS